MKRNIIDELLDPTPLSGKHARILNAMNGFLPQIFLLGTIGIILAVLSVIVS